MTTSAVRQREKEAMGAVGGGRGVSTSRKGWTGGSWERECRAEERQRGLQATSCLGRSSHWRRGPSMGLGSRAGPDAWKVLGH